MPHVTVVVPTYNRPQLLARLLAALEEQKVEVDFEVIVVDNASNTDTADVLDAVQASTSLDLIRLRIGSNRGPAPARNAGWRQARGEIVAFTDDDCIPDPGWLATGIAYFERDATLGVLQGKTLADPAVPVRRWAATQRIEQPTPYFEACNIFYRRDVLEATGGFAEGFGYYCEDTALGWAVVFAGWNRGFADDALVHHDVSYPGLAWFLRRGFMYGNFAAIVRREPRLRKRLLWAGLFLRPRTAAFALAVLGIVLGTFRREALVLTLPYLVTYRRPQRMALWAIRAQLEATAFDASIFIGLVRGSVRHRTLVL